MLSTFLATGTRFFDIFSQILFWHHLRWCWDLFNITITITIDITTSNLDFHNFLFFFYFGLSYNDYKHCTCKIMTAKNVRASQPYFWQNYQINKSEAKKYILYMYIALNGFHLTVLFCFFWGGGGGGHIRGCNFFLTSIVYLLLLFLIDIYFLWFCLLY